MAKVLFLSLPLTGHINPSLGLVQELVACGDEVVYFATVPFAARIEAAGARFLPYRSAILAHLSLPERTHELAWILMQATAEVLDQHLAEFRDEGPDYLITDSVAPWGQWLGEILRIPVVTSVSTFAVNRRVLAFAATHGVRPKSVRLILSKLQHVVKALLLGRRLRRRYGVRGPGITGLVMGRSDLNIVYTSRQFQPCAETFDDRFVFAGVSLGARMEAATFPWEEVRHPVLLYISLGTLFNTETTFFANCFRAFEGQDIQVILSLGSNVRLEELGPVPANFMVRAHVPQLEVLRRAAAFVTHGGMNSVSESLQSGVPMVIVPQMSEQEIVGQRVAELGAGLYLAKEEASPDRLRTCVLRLLEEPQFRRNAAAVGASLTPEDGLARAADAILRFTR